MIEVNPLLAMEASRRDEDHLPGCGAKLIGWSGSFPEVRVRVTGRSLDEAWWSFGSGKEGSRDERLTGMMEDVSTRAEPCEGKENYSIPQFRGYCVFS